MTTNKPEVVAWRWLKPVVNGQGETIGTTNWELSDTPGFLPWWTNESLIRLSDYEALVELLAEARDHVVSSTQPVRGGFIDEIDTALAAYHKGTKP